MFRETGIYFSNFWKTYRPAEGIARHRFVITAEDNGGVHINSGIPNRTICELAMRLKGNAWEKAGIIWYRTMTQKLRQNSNVRKAMNLTVMAAGVLFGLNSLEQKVARKAWAEVGM